MKAKYIIASLIAVCAFAIGCTKETPTLLDEIQVSSSYIGIPGDGGSKTITVNAKDSWTINEIPEWLTITPQNGSAGETKVTFSAEKAAQTNEGTVKILCAGKTQIIKILQQTQKVDPVTLTVAEALKVIEQYPDGSPVSRVKGVVCKIQEISAQYGNATYYLSDDGKFEDGKWLQVYRGLWMNGASFTKGDEFSLGDELVIEGVLMSYKGTPETKEKEAYVIEYNPSLIKCDSLVFNGAKLVDALPLEGGSFDAILTCKGDGVSVVIPEDAKSWLSVSGIKTEGTTAKVTFNAAANEAGDRTCDLTFTTTSGGKEYSAAASFAQKGAILEVSIAEFNAAPKSSTVYRISGFVTKVDDATKGNFHLKDYSAETYAYKATNFADYNTLKVGDIVTITGNRDEYNTTIELTNGVIENVKPVTTMTCAEAIALADDDKNDPKNYVMVTGVVTDGTAKGQKFDLNQYGNFDLVDESGSAYVYGVSTGWKGETKKFNTLGVKEGDKITIVAYKTSYTDSKGVTTDELVGMYFSHEAGETPEPPAPVVSEYSIDLAYTLGSNAYDDGVAIINGVEDQKVLKIGSSKAAGSLTFTVPAGSTKVTAYAIAWKGNATTLEFKIEDQVVGTQEIAANDGATGNSPYTITVADSDKYTLDLGSALSADTQVTVTTAADAKTRAIFFGVKAQ